MAKICNRCGRRKETPRLENGKRQRSSDHVCSTVVIQSKKKNEANGDYDTKIVHEDRVAKGGDLYGSVNSRKSPWAVVFRNKQKIESAIEKRKAAKAKKGEKVLVAPSGEPLTPPSKG